jgi:Family of unknown function (DUF6339)
MTHRITNRKALKTSEWLASATITPWRVVQPPPSEELKLQQFDLSAHVNTTLAVQAFKDAFERILTGLGDSPTRDERAETDGRLAAVLHRALDGITIREASDPDFWAYLACSGCAQYVRWRWDTPVANTLWIRYAGNIRRNALSRLWWWAETTCDHLRTENDPERYEITKKVRGRQTLMLWFGDCAFSGQSLIAQRLAALHETRLLNDSSQASVCKTVNRIAKIVCLDSLNTEAESDALCQRAFSVSQILNA